MANITPRTNKNGSTSYRIRVLAGVGIDGKQVFKSLTYNPEQGMTANQIQKEVARQAFQFEKLVQQGLALDSTMTVDELIDKWFREYAEKQLKGKTIENYKKLWPRVSAAIGHIKVNKLRPANLMQFYDNLDECGIRQDGKYKATKAFTDKCGKGTRAQIVEATGVSERTIASAVNGRNVCKRTAERLATAVGVPFSKAFRDVSPSTKLSGVAQHHYHLFLSSVFSTAVRWQVMPENPCKRVCAPKMADADVEYLDEVGVAHLLAALPDAPVQFSVLVQLALQTGCRRGELCALRWSDIDLEAGILSVQRTLETVQGVGQVFNTPKTRRSRRCIRLTDSAVQILREYKRVRAAECLRLGSAWVRRVEIEGKMVDNDLLFTRWNGLPIDPNVVTTWFPKFLQKHGLPRATFHSLRHTNAGLLIAAHVPVTTVSGRLGHAKTSTTTDIYAGFIRSSDAAAADALGAVFDRIGGSVGAG